MKWVSTRPTFLLLVMNETLSEQIKEKAMPILSQQGVELVDLLTNRGRRRTTIRLLVDKPEGITLDECARLNKEIGQALEEASIMQDSYILEVSSPGLDRPLKTTRDFERALGKSVRVVLHQPLNKQNVWKGKLARVDEENIVIEAGAQEEQAIPRCDIARVNVEVRV